MKNKKCELLADFSSRSGLIYDFFEDALRHQDYLLTTVRTWSPNLHGFVRWCEAETRGRATLADWSLTTLKLYLAFLKTKVTLKGRSGLRPRTIHSHFAALRAFERWCVDCKLLDDKPAAAIVLPEFDQPQRAILHPAEARAILAACEDLYPVQHRLRVTAVFSVFFCTGLRYEDVRGLRLRNVHFGTAPQDNFLVAEHSKGNQEFKIEMPPETVEALQAWLAEREGLRYVPENDWLWAITATRRIGEGWWKEVRREIEHRTGLTLGERFQAHACRRVWSVHAEDNGMPVSEISKKLNHKSLATTLLYLETGRDSRAENVHLQGWRDAPVPPPVPPPNPPTEPPPPSATSPDESPRRNARWRRKREER